MISGRYDGNDCGIARYPGFFSAKTNVRSEVKDGHLGVVCGRIQLFNQDGKFLDQWSNVLMPWGLSVTRDDQFWVCGSSPHWWFRHGKYPEYKDQVLMRFATNGRVLQTWMLPLGDIGTDKDPPDTSKLKPGETVGAHCIATDSKGNVYVGDIYGERAQKFVPISKR